MSIRILITRPAPSAADTADTLYALGYSTLVAPVLDATALPPYPCAINPDDRAIVTSPQAARALRDWAQFHTMPTIAVGDRTAEILRDVGFSNIVSVDGDAIAIASHIDTSQPQSFHLLCAPATGQWLEEKLVGDGHSVNRVHVYQIDTCTELSAPAQDAIKNGSITHALFYSAFTAETFLKLAARANLMGNLAHITACCLSPAVAKTISKARWQEIQVADTPNSTSLQRLLPAIE